MKAAIFVEPGRIALEDKPIPQVGPRDALLRVTTTTICGTDVHILKGEYRVARGLTVGHEPVGVIEELGSAVSDYAVGQRVIAGAITPCGQCHACLGGDQAQCGGKAMGGWRLGNTIDGCQAEYVLIPDATANLAPIPDALTDEQVLMCPDIMSTGFAGAERGRIRIGDTVAVFAQGPIGLCATVGARLSGATQVFTIDGLNERLTVSRQLGADQTINFLCSGTQFLPDEHGSESWGNFPRERQKLFRTIRESHANGVVLLSGDRHLAELMKLAPDEAGIGYSLFEATSSSLNAPSGNVTKAGVRFANEINRYRVGLTYFDINFGNVLVDWDQADPLVRVQVREEKVQVVLQQRLLLSQLQPSK